MRRCCFEVFHATITALASTFFLPRLIKNVLDLARIRNKQEKKTLRSSAYVKANVMNQFCLASRGMFSCQLPTFQARSTSQFSKHDKDFLKGISNFRTEGVKTGLSACLVLDTLEEEAKEATPIIVEGAPNLQSTLDPDLSRRGLHTISTNPRFA